MTEIFCIECGEHMEERTVICKGFEKMMVCPKCGIRIMARSKPLCVNCRKEMVKRDIGCWVPFIYEECNVWVCSDCHVNIAIPGKPKSYIPGRSSPGLQHNFTGILNPTLIRKTELR